MPAPASVRESIKQTYHRTFKTKFRDKRRKYIEDLIAKATRGQVNGRAKIVEVGCAGGKDFLTLVSDKTRYELYGIDNRDFSDTDGAADCFNFTQADGDNIPFEDKFFDVAISIGVLEHIKPILKLDKVTQEIDRVSKRYIVIVPSIATRLEPHRVQWNWQLKDPKHKVPDANLFYYSDEAWLQFSGFLNGSTHRIAYIPGLINNLVITNIPE